MKIQNRELALELANLWGSAEDVSRLQILVASGEIASEQRVKVLKFWEKKFQEISKLSSNGQIKLVSLLKSEYLFLRICEKHLGKCKFID